MMEMKFSDFKDSEICERYGKVSCHTTLRNEDVLITGSFEACPAWVLVFAPPLYIHTFAYRCVCICIFRLKESSSLQVYISTAPMQEP